MFILLYKLELYYLCFTCSFGYPKDDFQFNGGLCPFIPDLPDSHLECDYKLEIDSTQLFNSPIKKTYNRSSVGGLIEFSPTDISYTDSTVYYWRVAMVPRNNDAYIWNDFSFVYLLNTFDPF